MTSRRRYLIAAIAGISIPSVLTAYGREAGLFDFSLSSNRSCITTNITPFSRVPENPILEPSNTGNWDDYVVSFPHVVPGSPNKLYYTGKSSNGDLGVGVAYSKDMIHWSRYENNPILYGNNVTHPQVWREGDRYLMIFQENGAIKLAVSRNGIEWAKRDKNLIFGPNDAQWTSQSISGPGIIKLNKTYHLFYHAGSSFSKTGSKIGHATSTNLKHWKDDPANPILSPSLFGWDSSNLAGPRPFQFDNRLNFLYRGTDDEDQAIGRAVCCDKTWKRTSKSPIFRSGSDREWDGKLVEHVSLAIMDDTLYLFYSGESNEDGETDQIGLATSTWSR